MPHYKNTCPYCNRNVGGLLRKKYGDVPEWDALEDKCPRCKADVNIIRWKTPADFVIKKIETRKTMVTGL